MTDDERALVAARMVNWSRAMRDSVHPSGEAGLSPDELDAAKVEAVMIWTRQIRPITYTVLWQHYLARRTDVDAADKLRMHVQDYQARFRTALEWMHRELPPFVDATANIDKKSRRGV